jgi:hypothetical protein
MEFENSQTSFSQLLREARFQEALNMLEEDPDSYHEFKQEELTNLQFCQFVLQFGSPQVLYFFLQQYTNRDHETGAPVEFCEQAVRLFFQAIQERQLPVQTPGQEGYIGGVMGDIAYESLPESPNPGGMTIFRAMIQSGLNPNFVVEEPDKLIPLYICALKARNYEMMSILMETPGFNLTPEVLESFNAEVQAIDMLREKMIYRLNPARGSASGNQAVPLLP